MWELASSYHTPVSWTRKQPTCEGAHEYSPGLWYLRTQLCPWPAPQDLRLSPQPSFHISTSSTVSVHHLLYQHQREYRFPTSYYLKIYSQWITKVKYMVKSWAFPTWNIFYCSKGSVIESMTFIKKMSPSEIISSLEMSPTKSQGDKHL